MAVNKVIVEIDDPKGCDSCPVMDATPAGDYNDSEYLCIPANRELDLYTVLGDVRPDWCPLRPTPILSFFRDGTATINTEQNPWIPCETYRRDSLPPKSGKYEVTIKDGSNYHVSIRKFRAPENERNRKSAGFYHGDCWERHTGGVVAWRYLPKPYRPEMVPE